MQVLKDKLVDYRSRFTNVIIQQEVVDITTKIMISHNNK